MKKILFFAIPLLLLVACYKDKNVQDNNSPAHTVSMKNSAFSPPSLQVNINVTVTWINDDNMVHTVTADDGTFNSGDMAPGVEFRHTFRSTGTFNYHCVHHSGMVGTIISTGIR